MGQRGKGAKPKLAVVGHTDQGGTSFKDGLKPEPKHVDVSDLIRVALCTEQEYYRRLGPC